MSKQDFIGGGSATKMDTLDKIGVDGNRTKYILDLNFFLL